VTDLPASAFTTEELHRCALRELGLRKRVYPNRIETGRMTAEQAAKQIMMMQAIVDLLAELARSERLL
jgi:uncharacterized protein YndB with AHSA1/START domain